MTLIPSPMPDTEQQAQLATDELIATAQALITLGAPTLSPKTLHEWLDSPEKLLGFPTNNGTENTSTQS